MYQTLFAFVAEDSPSWGTLHAPLKAVGVMYMILFRIVFLWALFYAGSRVWRGRWNWDDEVYKTSFGYLLFVGAFLAPYLVAWGTERRLVPVIIPCLVFVWWAGENDLRIRDGLSILRGMSPSTAIVTSFLHRFTPKTLAATFEPPWTRCLDHTL